MCSWQSILIVIFAVVGSALAQVAGQQGPKHSRPVLLKSLGEHLRVNGVSVKGVTAVYSGDRIATGRDTAALLMMPGEIVTLDRKSVAVFENGSVVLSQGRGWVNATGHKESVIAPGSALRADTNDIWGRGRGKDENNEGNKDDRAEERCERQHHRECVCHDKKEDHDCDDVSPANPHKCKDDDDVVCRPVGKH